MRRPRSTPLLAAALLAFLSACASRDEIRAGVYSTAREMGARPLDVRSFAPACPTPTPDAKKLTIADELEAALPTGRPPNTLAEEWERLDEAARACRERTAR